MLLLGTLLTGCVTTRSCTVGLTFFGPIPVPHAGCEVQFAPAEKD